MPSASNIVEAVYFKPAVDGFIFQAPSLRFSAKRSYMVSAAQKPAILAALTANRSRRRPYVLLVAALIALLWVAAVTTAVWAMSPAGRDGPTMGEGLVIMLLTAVPLIGAIVLATTLHVRAQLRRLQPILAGLPQTDQRISAKEQRAAVAGFQQMRSMLIVLVIVTAAGLFQAGCLGFIVGMKFAAHRLSFGTLPFSTIVTFACTLVLIAHWTAMAMRKARRS
jgi:type III secretory pathway component EscS